MSNEELRRAFDALWGGSESRSWVKGRLGKTEADGTIVIKSGRPGFVFVRLGAEGDQGTAVARNIGVPLKNYLPVRMRVDPQLGYYVIYSIDFGARYDAFSGGNEKSYNVGPHTHMIGSGLEYPIEALRIDPGRPQCTSALTVSIEQFRYYFNGSWDTWQNTGTIDLTAYKPASAKWCWVLVGVNPATNALVAVKGADYDTQAALTDDLIDSIAFVEYIPCGAVQVAYADTALTDISRWKDARGWINQPVADLDGVPGVTIASEAENDSFWYDGSGWVNGVGHRLNMAASTVLTIASGTLNIDGAKTNGLIEVRGESSLDDDLDTISGGNVGDIIVLWTPYPGVYGNITVTDSDNIYVSTANILLNSQYEIVALVYATNGWQVISPDKRLDTATVTMPTCLATYVDIKARNAVQNIHGNFFEIATAQPLDDTPTDLVFTNGIGKFVLIVNAGTDYAGTITVTGTSVNRDTGAETGADTEDIVIDALTTDASAADANGTIVHDLTGAYISSKWWKGSVTLSTADLTLTDVDVWGIAFEQLNDDPTAIVETIDMTLLCNNTAGWADLYFYIVNVTAPKCNIGTVVDMHVTTAESTADRYYRLREGSLAASMDGSTDGGWAELALGPPQQAYWEDINLKVWFTVEAEVTLN